jgi:hypothetical protein
MINSSLQDLRALEPKDNVTQLLRSMEERFENEMASLRAENKSFRDEVESR